MGLHVSISGPDQDPAKAVSGMVFTMSAQGLGYRTHLDGRGLFDSSRGSAHLNVPNEEH